MSVQVPTRGTDRDPGLQDSSDYNPLLMVLVEWPTLPSPAELGSYPGPAVCFGKQLL